MIDGCNDRALTGLELIILICVLIGTSTAVIVFVGGSGSHSPPRTFPGGLVAESMYMSGDGIQQVGSVYGLSAIPSRSTIIPVVYRQPNVSRMGAVQLTMSLFIGDTGAIDTDHLNVTWNTRTTYEQLKKQGILERDVHLICPNWTIAGKYNMLPGRTADSDEWLEPGEQFLVIICPSTPSGSYEPFTLGMYPDGVAIPLRITRTVPFPVRPVMNLG